MSKAQMPDHAGLRSCGDKCWCRPITLPSG